MSDRIRVIDGLRGISILLVLLFHFTSIYPEKYSIGTDTLFLPSVSFGGVGVSIFFVVSGLVIMKSLQGGNVFTFLISRISRLYPAYIFSVLLTSLLLFLFGDWYGEVSLYQVIANMTMFQYYLLVDNVDGVYWSLRVEVAFYFLSAAAFFIFNSRGYLIFLITYSIMALLYNSLISHIESHALLIILAKLVIFEFINLFLLGVSIFKLWLDRSSPAGLDKLGYYLVVLIALIDLLINKPDYKFIVISLTTVVIYLTAKKPEYRLHHLLTHKSILFLGRISYSLYLIHQVIGYILIRGLQEWGFNINISILISIAAVIAISYFVQIFVEQRLSNSVRLFLSQKLSKMRS